MINIGKLIKDKLEESDHTIVWFAKELSCSRTNVYKILSKQSIDTNELLRISKILRYNFFDEYAKELHQEEE